MEKITSCHLSFSCRKTRFSLRYKVHFCAFSRVPMLCAIFLSISRPICVFYAPTLLSLRGSSNAVVTDVTAKKQKYCSIRARVMHVYARGRKEALRQKKEVASRARKLRRCGRLDAVLASERKQRRQGRKDATQTKKRKCMGKCRERMGVSEYLCLYSGKKKQMR